MSASYEPSDSSYDRFFPEEPPRGELPDGAGIPAVPQRQGPGNDADRPAMFRQPPVDEQRPYQSGPAEPRAQYDQPRSQPEPGRPNVVAWPRQYQAAPPVNQHPQYGQPPPPGQPARGYAQPAEQPYGQPAEYSYGQPEEHTYGPPAEHTYGPPAEHTYGPPAEHSYGQPDEYSYGQPEEHSYGRPPVSEAPSQSRAPFWTSTAPPQRSAFPDSAPPQGGQHQPGQAVPDWMLEPVDSQRYVDRRVGDDEESLTYSADRLDLVGARKLPASRGWRKLLYHLTFRKVNLGLSPAEVAYDEMVSTIRQPITGDYKLAVLSLKGGVGKTTTTVTLGSTFAQLRKGDRVVALDANPDFGNLVSRVAKQTNTTVKDLLADENLSRYGDVRRHTSQNTHGLEIVAGERDMAQSERFSKAEFERVMAVLEQHYSLILSDCGTGVINEAMAGVLETTNGMILVSSVTVDGARAVSANIEWLRVHGYHHLVEHAVVVLNSNKTNKSSANIDQLKEHFSPHVRAVHAIPFDDHLAEGAEVNLALLNKKTRRAFEELAEIIATDFPSATGKHTREG